MKHYEKKPCRDEIPVGDTLLAQVKCYDKTRAAHGTWASFVDLADLLKHIYTGAGTWFYDNLETVPPVIEWPDWARWMATDPDGQVRFYENRPVVSESHSHWCGTGGRAQANKETCPNWKGTLVERPLEVSAEERGHIEALVKLGWEVVRKRV